MTLLGNPSVTGSPASSCAEPDRARVDGDAGVADSLCRFGQPLGGRSPYGGGCNEPQAGGSRFCVAHRDRLHKAMAATTRKRSPSIAGTAGTKPAPTPAGGTEAPAKRGPHLSTDQQAKKDKAIDAIVTYVEAHPDAGAQDIHRGAGIARHRIAQAVAAGRIVAQGRRGYVTTNNNEETN